MKDVDYWNDESRIERMCRINGKEKVIDQVVYCSVPEQGCLYVAENNRCMNLDKMGLWKYAERNRE